MTTWLDLLRTEVAASSMQKAATRLGISRTAVSLCLSGKYGASTEHVESKVWKVLGQVECLALGEPISPTACHDYRERKPPLHNSVAMRHWRACQHCLNNPNCANREEANRAIH